MLGALKKAFTGSVNRYSGRKDFLEGVCAAAALVAAADGDIEDSEVSATITAIKANAQLSQAFDDRAIETTAEAMLKRAVGRVGRMGLMKEIEEASKDAEMAETIYAVALDVSESDGEVEPQEKVVLAKIAQALKVDPKKFDV